MKQVVYGAHSVLTALQNTKRCITALHVLQHIPGEKKVNGTVEAVKRAKERGIRIRVEGMEWWKRVERGHQVTETNQRGLYKKTIQ